MDAIPLGALAMTLGEAPIWNPHRDELTVVDIFGRAVHTIFHDEGKWVLGSSIATETDTGAVVPLDSGELVSVEAGGVFALAGGRRDFVCPVPGVVSEDYRPNDAKLGPDGRLHVGVMDYAATEGAGSLWALDRAGTSELLLEGLTIPNGMDWWEDTFWFVDGPEPKVSAYRQSGGGFVKCGEISTRGIPDGISLDSVGNVWVALWGEGRVDCYGQDGRLLHQVVVPAQLTTSVAFCGPSLTTLAITTARYQLTVEQCEKTPHAGDVFFVEAPLPGRAANMTWAS